MQLQNIIIDQQRYTEVNVMYIGINQFSLGSADVTAVWEFMRCESEIYVELAIVPK